MKDRKNQGARPVRSPGIVAALFAFWLVLSAAPSAAEPTRAEEFERTLAFIDQTLRENPNVVPPQALYACQSGRNRANRLYFRGHHVRALRGLKYCFNLLGVSASDMAPAPQPERERDVTRSAIRDQAEKEGHRVLELAGDATRGLEIYRQCAACHTPEGWGMTSGVVPQLAGQHRSVIIKQLADIRAGYRKNRVMAPYSSVESIGGPQAVADVAAYIDTLDISIENGKGAGTDLSLGKMLYNENCAACHGPQGEGNNEDQVPRIQAQHYGYLVEQFDLIRKGERGNANPTMVEQIKGFTDRDVHAVMDYVSRLQPPEEFQAPPDWRNPDFAHPSN